MDKRLNLAFFAIHFPFYQPKLSFIMWQGLGKFVLKYRAALLILLFSLTALMGYFASQVKLSYEFARAIPTDNPKYKDYMAFRQNLAMMEMYWL